VTAHNTFASAPNRAPSRHTSVCGGALAEWWTRFIQNWPCRPSGRSIKWLSPGGRLSFSGGVESRHVRQRVAPLLARGADHGQILTNMGTQMPARWLWIGSRSSARPAENFDSGKQFAVTRRAILLSGRRNRKDRNGWLPSHSSGHRHEKWPRGSAPAPQRPHRPWIPPLGGFSERMR
jgi:hypothetical protein